MQASTERRSCCSALICRPGAPSCVREPKTNFLRFKRAIKFSFLINSFNLTQSNYCLLGEQATRRFTLPHSKRSVLARHVSSNRYLPPREKFCTRDTASYVSHHR